MAQRSFNVKDSVLDNNKSSKNRDRKENITNDNQEDDAQEFLVIRNQAEAQTILAGLFA